MCQNAALCGNGLKNQTELSVVLSCILALSSITTNRLLGASLRCATGSKDKQTEITNQPTNL